MQATATYTPGGDGGELDTVTYANGTTLAPVTRDVAGRTTTVEFKAGATTRVKSTVTRSQSGRVLTDTTDPGGIAVAYTYDTVGRLVRANGNGHDYSYCYDQTIANCGAGHVAATGKNTNRVTFLDGAGVVAGYSYDPADRLTATTQSGYTGAITYDGHGNTTAVGGQTLYYDQPDGPSPGHHPPNGDRHLPA